jgi:predicted ATPase
MVLMAVALSPAHATCQARSDHCKPGYGNAHRPLVLDNREHLIDACAAIVEALLQGARAFNSW